MKKLLSILVGVVVLASTAGCKSACEAVTLNLKPRLQQTRAQVDVLAAPLKHSPEEMTAAYSALLGNAAFFDEFAQRTRAFNFETHSVAANWEFGNVAEEDLWTTQYRNSDRCQVFEYHFDHGVGCGLFSRYCTRYYSLTCKRTYLPGMHDESVKIDAFVGHLTGIRDEVRRAGGAEGFYNCRPCVAAERIREHLAFLSDAMPAAEVVACSVRELR